ncbi:molybdopterin molybdotransferase MoeA [Kordiimonas aestuarii]|uniref:molybdopterin molybdotransferase MoeA n=1 Tax=Kordiimonas aestuarii TaxID=1005925 RepID=UPI0021D255AF|nr:gephyrin-like molybdotransferase Glp [Kordiimonas aestuarii]
MISVEKAFERIVADAKPLTTERLPVAQTSGRVLAAPLAARRSQPGCDLSAMDGYAIRSAELTGDMAELAVAGESAAGAPFPGALTSGQAVRIFTGAAVPEGADQVIIQENVERRDDRIFTREAAQSGKNIRFMGIDFLDKQIVLDAGTFMTPKSIGLAASAGHSHLMVHRAPKVAILATGDELAPPEQKSFAPHETVNSTAPQIAALLTDAGAVCTCIGQAGDSLKSLQAAIKKAKAADILITLGGASVGDKDLMQQALSSEGMELGFWKVAMRPGKPLIFGQIGDMKVLGLPGNPVSAFVCALLFARPLVDQLMGRPSPMPTGVPLPLAADMPANGPRQHYVRARLIGIPGQRALDPAVDQDSSLLSVLSQSDGLIIRAPDAPAAKAGEFVPFLPF